MLLPGGACCPIRHRPPNDLLACAATVNAAVPAADRLALATLSEATLCEAASRFGFQVFAAWGSRERRDQHGSRVRPRLWESPTTAKQYRQTKRSGSRLAPTPHPSDLLDHLEGRKVIAISHLAECIVIDAAEANPSEELKQQAAEAVSVLLDSFGIPHVHFNGQRRCHTWIRLQPERGEAE